MERRYFLSSTCIVVAGTISKTTIPLVGNKISNSALPLLDKFKSDLSGGLNVDGDNACDFSGLTKIEKVINESARPGQSYFYYQSASGDRILLYASGSKEQVIINPIDPSRYFTHV